jgi:ribonuclease D
MKTPQFELVSAAEMKPVCEALRSAGRIGLDTEFMRESTFYPQLCLVQIATDESIYCIDPLETNDLDSFWDTLALASCVLHSGRQDVEVLYLLTGRMPRQVFDTQVAAGLLGYAPQLGYGALVSELFDVDLPKTHTRADWSRRPLTPALLEYAAQDVEYLLPARNLLAERLEKLGRLDWAEEDSRDLLNETLYAADPVTAVQRLKGANRLPGRARRAAGMLAAWREQEAISRDRPRQWIMKDATLLELAAAGPRDLAALKRIGSLPPATVRRAGKTLLGLLAEARGEPAGDEAPVGRLDDAGKAELRQMQSLVAGQARELGLQPEVVASRKELSAAQAGERKLKVFRGWRRELVGDRLLEMLER